MKQAIKLLICLICLIRLIGFAPLSGAADMTSPAYQIQFPNLNMMAGQKSSENYKLGDTAGQTGSGLYASTGYKVRAGFWYIKSIIPFSFAISSMAVNFGTIAAGTPSTQTNTLTVSAGGAGGYQVTGQENYPLKMATGTTIPDTTCDSGTCSETTAGVWVNNTTYGFGYNMSGNDVPAAFIDSTYYKQFADRSLGESAQIVMSSINVGKSRQATVTYKVNVSGAQAAGVYRNMITFIATPSF